MKATSVLARERWKIVAVIVFFILFAWSLLSYLVIRVDSDIVAEAIQVQLWLEKPFLVLSYPGQLYGGVLEYPLIAAAELLAPGQVYALTAVRVFYLPLVGVLAVYATHLLFPHLRLWPFIPAVAAGPAVLHSMMAIKDLYPLSWLLAMVGIALTFRQWNSRGGVGLSMVGAVLVGLSIYQHPTTSLLALPLAVAGFVRWWPRGKALWWWIAGVVIGLLPLVVARFGQGEQFVSYQPERTGLPNFAGALGFSEQGWPPAIVPHGWGVQNTDLNVWAFPSLMQIVVNAAISVFLVLCVIVVMRTVVRRQCGAQDSPLVVVATMWASALVVVFAIVLVVPPVFFYGAALAVPVWITLVVGINKVAGVWGRAAAYAIVVLAAITSLGSVFALNPALPGAVGFKNAQAAQIRQIAQDISQADIRIIFGDYWETLPIAYASSGDIRAVTIPVSRFAIPDDVTGVIRVAVPTGYTALPPGLDRWANARDAVGFVDAQCVRLPQDVVVDPYPIRTYECPVEIFR